MVLQVQVKWLAGKIVSKMTYKSVDREGEGG